MKKLRFKPRATFNADLKRLASLDKSIIDEVRAAIDLLLEQQQLPSEFEDHELNRRMSVIMNFTYEIPRKTKHQAKLTMSWWFIRLIKMN